MLECIYVFHLNVKCVVQCSGLFHFRSLFLPIVKPMKGAWTLSILIVWIRFDNVFTFKLTFHWCFVYVSSSYCIWLIVRLQILSCTPEWPVSTHLVFYPPADKMKIDVDIFDMPGFIFDTFVKKHTHRERERSRHEKTHKSNRDQPISCSMGLSISRQTTNRKQYGGQYKDQLTLWEIGKSTQQTVPSAFCINAIVWIIFCSWCEFYYWKWFVIFIHFDTFRPVYQ